jgi:C-terminal processing protease CtpA/Prc
MKVTTDARTGLVRVSELVPEGAAAVSNMVFEGDVIEAVNGHELHGSSHERVIELLLEKTDVKLELSADDSPLPEPHAELRAALELEDIRVVELNRGQRGLGMKVSHPEDRDTGAVITNLVPGGAAFESGQVFLNDVIVEVDGVPVLDLPHTDIIVMLTTRTTVTLTLSSDLSLLGVEAVDRRVVNLIRDPAHGLGMKVVTDERTGVARISAVVPGGVADVSGEVE